MIDVEKTFKKESVKKLLEIVMLALRLISCELTRRVNGGSFRVWPL